jgi:hypothetical protein
MNSSSIHIIGAGRGGTSLLAGLIDAHPRCEIIYETLSATYLVCDTDADRVAEQGRSLEQRTRRRVGRFVDAWGEEASRHPGMVWGHKTTTEQIRALTKQPPPGPADFDPIGYFVETLSAVPTVFILRDGRTCIPSKMSRAGRSLDFALSLWAFSVEYLKRLRASDTPLHVVKMEDLVRNPVPALKEICAFVGLPYDERMLDGTANKKMLPEYRHGRFEVDKVELPDAPPEWVSKIEAELVYCGYLDPV